MTVVDVQDIDFAMSCAVCGHGEDELVFEVAGYRVVDCKGCMHRFVRDRPRDGHVQEIYGDDYFFGGGDGYSNYLEEAELLVERGREYQKLMRPYVGAKARLLDVGAAAGFVLKGLLSDGWQGEGVEPNEKMAAYARDTVGVKVTATPLERFASPSAAPETQDGPPLFDVITLIQVLPHFYDIEAALDAIFRITRTGSHLFVETWDKDSKTAKLFGKRWHEYSPPSVLHWFSGPNLDRFVRRYGFERVAAGRPARKLSLGHAKSLLSHKLSGTPLSGGALSGAFGKLTSLVPDSLSVTYPGDDLMWLLYRRI